MGQTPATRHLGILFAAAQDLPATVHRAAFAAATRADDRGFLCTLVKRADAPYDLVGQYAQLPEPDTTTAYRSRPTQAARSTAPRTASPERRTSVLVALLEDGQARPGAVRDALAAFAVRPTKVLATALLGCEALWFTPEQATDLLRAVGKGAVSGRVAFYQMATFASRCGLANVQVLLAGEPNEALVAALCKCDLPVQVLTDAVTAVMRRASAASPGNPIPTDVLGNLRGVASAALGGRKGAELAAIQLAITTSCRVRSLPQLLDRNLVAHAVYHQVQQWDTRPADMPGPPEGTTATEQLPLEQVVHARVCALRPSSGQTPRGLIEVEITDLLRHPCLTVTDRHELVARLVALADAGATLYGPTGAPRALDAIALFPEDAVVASAWVKLFPLEILRRYGWEPFGGQSAAAPALRNLLQEFHETQGPRSRGALLTALGDRATPWLALKQLPLCDLDVLNAKRGPTAEQVSYHMAADLDHAFGSDVGRWDAYCQLSETFTGSFEELMDICRTLSA